MAPSCTAPRRACRPRREPLAAGPATNARQCVAERGTRSSRSNGGPRTRSCHRRPKKMSFLNKQGADHGIELLTVAPAMASSRAPDLEEEKPNTPYDSVVREQ